MCDAPEYDLTDIQNLPRLDVHPAHGDLKIDEPGKRVYLDGTTIKIVVLEDGQWGLKRMILQPEESQGDIDRTLLKLQGVLVG